MLLAIDIGNTLTKFGFYENDSLIRRFDSPTFQPPAAETIFVQTSAPTIDAVIISTVVPELKSVYLDLFQEHFRLEPIFVDSTFDFGLRINYSPPENLGVDRLIAAFAAIEKYGETCVVGDFGTATTIDIVASDREFLGGIIAPGMKTMSESLFTKTAQLPRVEIIKPETVIGNSTLRAIQSGIYFGYIGLVDGIIKRMREELGGNPKVIATGGFASLIAESSAEIEVVNDSLLLEGLRLLYEKRLR